MKLTLKLATRGRPQQFLATINQWIALAKDVNQIEILVSCDLDDVTMNNEWFKSKLNLPRTTLFFGNNKTKVEAYNADLNHATGDVFVVIGDDVTPTPHWDAAIIEDMKRFFPDTDGVLHYPDGIQTEGLCTHPVMGRKYYERFGYIAHPSYKGLYADNELTAVAKSLGKLKFIDRILFRHDHPSLGVRKSDACNKRDLDNEDYDRMNHEFRRDNKFRKDISIEKHSKSQKQVLVAILSNGYTCADTAGAVAGVCLQSAYHCSKDFVIRGVMIEKCSIIDSGRNHVVRQALALPGLTHLLFLDADMTFPPTLLQTLMAEDKDVIGCNAMRRAPPFTPAGTQRPDGKWILGCAVMLIKMDVFRKLEFPYFDGHYLPGGDYVGEDQDFCWKVNEFTTVHCHEELSKSIGHIGQMSFTLDMHEQAGATL